ncbi:MAG: HAD-IA family hydrolase [Chloroflexi bacterium]|nr:HAD-IA family hydrolase [Chloroflexota bacterium]
MIKAVLLDLDNTLLDNPQDVFVVEYLRAVDQYFAEHWQMSVSGALVKSTRIVLAARDAQQTNTSVVVDVLAKELQRPPKTIMELFEGFYQESYPALQQHSRPVAWAAELIQHLREEYFAVVIATNPLYPAEAIRQRLAWAGLPDTLEYYALVTHGDNMHFAKPDPAYYAEILARVGVEPDEALMVGDSLESDIEPAALVGLHTYHLKTSADGEGAGTLADFYALSIEDNWTNHFPARRLMPAMIEPEMRGNLGALFGMLSQVKDHYWHQHPDRDEWSIMQIICHLLESEQTVQRPRLQRILQEDNPFLTAPRRPAGADAVPCADEGYQVARAFVAERQTTMQFLRALQHEDWMRPARHSIFGPTTLLEMAHFTAQHDRLHLKQLCRTLGKCE